MKIRPLSRDLQEKAEKELNEIPNQIEENLRHIKDWLEKQEHIKYKDDDQLLVNFLRTSKYSLERTKQKLDAYYSFRTIAPEIAQNMDPLLLNVQAVLEMGFCVPLPISKESSADSRVYLVRQVNYDPDEVTFISMLKVAAISISIDINDDDNFVVSGVKVLWDLNGLQLRTATQITPQLLKKSVHLFQTCYPSRVKSMHLVNIPKFMEPILNMLKLLSSKKFANRLYFHTAGNLEEVYKDIPRSILPKEYGGDAGSFNDLKVDWKKRVEGNRERLLNENNYFTDETKRSEKGDLAENIFGTDGSFRKLEVD